MIVAVGLVLALVSSAYGKYTNVLGAPSLMGASGTTADPEFDSDFANKARLGFIIAAGIIGTPLAVISVYTIAMNIVHRIQAARSGTFEEDYPTDVVTKVMNLVKKVQHKGADNDANVEYPAVSGQLDSAEEATPAPVNNSI